MSDTEAQPLPSPSPAMPPDHPAAPSGKIGVLLIALGTPDSTRYWPMRRYLSEFLSDKRVIDYPGWFWQPLLQGVILTSRPFRSGAAYRSIWNTDKDESPLRTITRDQAERLQDRLGDDVVVDWGMRYGAPSVEDRLEDLHKAGCRKVFLFALYPQYSATTTATAYDQSFRALMKQRWQPTIRTAPPYHDDPAYIDALARSMRKSLDRLDFEPETVVASFHGLPVRYHISGDPYHCHCAKTARLLREALGWPEDKLRIAFQSRFGPEKWLEPATDDLLERLAHNGVKRVAVISPGFSSDCVETLEELAIEGEEEFLAAGGERFAYLPCLNAEPEGIDVLEAITRRELQGWLSDVAATTRAAAE